MNKILFLGDSFTWGQGLYFYKWKEEGREMPVNVGGMFPSHSDLIKDDDLEYKDRFSFTGLVSAYYNLTPIKRFENGGSNTEILLDALNLIDKHNNSIEKLVFQFTTISRYQFRDLNMGNIDNCEGTFDDIFNERTTNFFYYVDGILKYFSNLYNFKYCYMDWLGDFYHILPDKFVKYNIGDITYNYFGEFLNDYKIDININSIPIIDLHLNKDGQTISATSIIEHFG